MGKACSCCGKKPEECRNKHHRFDSDKYDPAIRRFVKTTPSIVTEEKTVIIEWQLDQNGNRTGQRQTIEPGTYEEKDRRFGRPVFTVDEEKIIVDDNESLSDAEKEEQEFIVSQNSSRTGLIERETTVWNRVYNESRVETRLALMFNVRDMNGWDTSDFQGRFKYTAQKLAIMMSDNVDGFENEEDHNPKIRVHGLYYNDDVPDNWRKINQMIERSQYEKEIDFKSSCNKLFENDESAWIDLEKWLVPELANEDPDNPVSRDDIEDKIMGEVLRGNGTYMFLFEPVEGSTQLGAKPCSFTFYETKTHRDVTRSPIPYIFLEFVRRRGQCIEDDEFVEKAPPLGVSDYTNERLREILAFPGYNWHDDFTRVSDETTATYTSRLEFLTEEYELNFDEFYRQDFFWRFGNTFSYKLYRPRIDNTRRGRQKTFLDFSQKIPDAGLKFPNEITAIAGGEAEWSDTNYDYEMYQRERGLSPEVDPNVSRRSLIDIVRKDNMPPAPFVYNMNITIGDQGFTAREIPAKHYNNTLIDPFGFGATITDRQIINSYHRYPYSNGGLDAVQERVLDYNQLYGMRILQLQVSADSANLNRQLDNLEESLTIDKNNPDYVDFTYWDKGWICYPDEKSRIDGYFEKYCFQDKVEQIIAGFSVKNNKIAVELSVDDEINSAIRGTYFDSDSIEGGHPGFYTDQILNNYDQYVIDPEESLENTVFSFTISESFYAPILRFVDCYDPCNEDIYTDHFPAVNISINAPFDTDDCYKVYGKCSSKLITVPNPSAIKKLEYHVEGAEQTHHYTDEFYSLGFAVVGDNIKEITNLVCEEPEDLTPTEPPLGGGAPPNNPDNDFRTSADVTWDFNLSDACFGDQELPKWTAKFEHTNDPDIVFQTSVDCGLPENINHPDCLELFNCSDAFIGVGRTCFTEDTTFPPCPQKCAFDGNFGSVCVNGDVFDLEEEREKIKETLEPNGGIVGDCTGVRFNKKTDRNFTADYWDEIFDANTDVKSITQSAGTETEFSLYADEAVGITSDFISLLSWSDFARQNIITGSTPYTTKENLSTLKVYYADPNIFGFNAGLFEGSKIISYSVNWPAEWWKYTDTLYWDESIDVEDIATEAETKDVYEHLKFDGQLLEITREKKFDDEEILLIQLNLFDDAYLIYLVTDEEPIQDKDGNDVEQNGYWRITRDNHEGPFQTLPFPIFKPPAVYKIQTDITYYGAVPSLLEHKKRDSLWTPQSETEIQSFLVNVCDSRSLTQIGSNLTGFWLSSACPTYGYSAVNHRDFQLIDSQATKDYALAFRVYDQFIEKGCLYNAQCWFGNNAYSPDASRFTRGAFIDNSYHCDDAGSAMTSTSPFQTIKNEFEWSDYECPEGYLTIVEDESPQEIEIERKQYNLSYDVCKDHKVSKHYEYNFTIDVIAYPSDNPKNRYEYSPEFSLYEGMEGFHKTYSQKKPFFNSVISSKFSCFSSMVWLKLIDPDVLSKRSLNEVATGDTAAVRNIRPGVTGNHKDNGLLENNLYSKIEAQLENQVYLPSYKEKTGNDLIEQAFPFVKDIRDREEYDISDVEDYYGRELFYKRKILLLGDVSESNEDHDQQYPELSVDTSIEGWNKDSYIAEFAGCLINQNGQTFPKFDYKVAFNDLMTTSVTRNGNKISSITSYGRFSYALPEFEDASISFPDGVRTPNYSTFYRWPHSWVWDQPTKEDDPETIDKDESAELCLAKSSPAVNSDGQSKTPETLDYGAFWLNQDLRSRGHVSSSTTFDPDYSNHIWTSQDHYIFQLNDPKDENCTGQLFNNLGFQWGGYCRLSGYMGAGRYGVGGYVNEYIESKLYPLVSSNLRKILEAGEGTFSIRSTPTASDPSFPNVEYSPVSTTVINLDDISITVRT